MNNNYFFRFTILLGVLFMFLQNTSAQYAVGIKGGLNICNYWGTDLNSNYQTKFAPVFGLMARYQKNQTFSFLAELNYDMRGANYDEIIDDGIIYKVEYQDINKAVNYISLPLYAKWGFGQKKLFYGIAGLYGAVAVSANIEGIQVITNKYDPYDVTVIPVDADIKDNVKSFDMGALIGLGMDFKLGTAMDLMFDCRYNWGWLNTAGQGQGYVANTDWAFNLGLLFNLRKKNTE